MQRAVSLTAVLALGALLAAAPALGRSRLPSRSFVKLTKFFIANWSSAPGAGLGNYKVALDFNNAVGQGLLKSFGVTVVILLGFDVRPDILRRHQSNAVSLSCEQAAKMMRPATCLHADNASRQLCGQVDERIPPNPST